MYTALSERSRRSFIPKLPTQTFQSYRWFGPVEVTTYSRGEWHTRYILQPVFSCKRFSGRNAITVRLLMGLYKKRLRLIVYLSRKSQERGNISCSSLNIVPSYKSQAQFIARLYPTTFLSWVSGSEESLERHLKQLFIDRGVISQW